MPECEQEDEQRKETGEGERENAAGEKDLAVVERGIAQDLSDELQVEKDERLLQEVLFDPAGRDENAHSAEAEEDG